MPLTIETQQVRARVIRRDRRECATEIWLICEHGRSQTVGIALEPEKEDWFQSEGLDPFSHPPIVELETTELDHGIWCFNFEAFARRALEEALGPRSDRLTLTPQNSAEWGGKRVEDIGQQGLLRRWYWLSDA